MLPGALSFYEAQWSFNTGFLLAKAYITRGTKWNSGTVDIMGWSLCVCVFKSLHVHVHVQYQGLCHFLSKVTQNTREECKHFDQGAIKDYFKEYA